MALGNGRQRQTKVLLRQVGPFDVAVLRNGHVLRLVWLQFGRKFSSDIQAPDLRLLRQVPNGLWAIHLAFLVQLLENPAGRYRVDWKGPTLLR